MDQDQPQDLYSNPHLYILLTKIVWELYEMPG